MPAAEIPIPCWPRLIFKRVRRVNRRFGRPAEHDIDTTMVGSYIPHVCRAGKGEWDEQPEERHGRVRKEPDVMTRKSNAGYRITFRDVAEDKFVTIKARRIAESTLGPAFVEVSDVFFDDGKLIVNPQEEALRDRFNQIQRLHVAIYHIAIIEELGTGTARLKLPRSKDGANVVILEPAPPY